MFDFKGILLRDFGLGRSKQALKTVTVATGL